MFYKITRAYDLTADLEPLSFLAPAARKSIEDEIETLFETTLLEVLFEEAALMPFFQKWHPEAAMYVLNPGGDLVIFELKQLADASGMPQVLHLAQDASQWTFSTIQEKYRKYCGKGTASLAESHKEAFNLERSLLPSEFNTRQNLVIVGNAADDSLINAVDYWKQRGVLVDFYPYRVYTIKDEKYFEFFALPYDCRNKPSLTKGANNE
jgi:hypothetical protein